MSNDDIARVPKQGWLKIKLHSQTRWHRRYCMIDWDKAILFISSKTNRHYRDWIKLLPNIFINEYESSIENIIEIRSDNQSHLLQFESKTEHDSWFIALKTTAYSRIGGGIFGQSLDDTFKYAPDKTSPVPFIVRQCCEYLLEHGSSFVGLFRVPGKQSSIKELRDMYDRGLAVELNGTYSPATVSSVLKNYLQSLPEPIIPTEYFDEFFEIGSSLKYNQTNDIERLKRLIESTLQRNNYALLSYLCLFLKKLTEHAHETKMDTDNLAVTFGSNLIRSPDDIDLNMIKGYSYNLLPLIKALIDHSEYLFPMQTNESSEPHNESIMKSSGFSSFSSLLSSNEQSIKANARSSSLPSIHCGTFSSIENSNMSYNDQTDVKQQRVDTSEQLNSQQSFVTCFEKDFTIDQQINDHIITSDELRKEKYKTKNILSEWTSKSNTSSPIRKNAKKTFANKLGKSFLNFKSNMSRAFHPHYSSTTGIHEEMTKNSPNSNFLNDCIKILQNEIHILKDLIEKKENLIIQLTQTSDDERLQYEKEKFQLRQAIEQLQNENSQLKMHYQSDI